ncbi:MAG: glycosyltransferase [Patulibacter sp.]
MSIQNETVDLPPALSRCDLHVHTTASEFTKLGVQRLVGLPECATPPEDAYDLAKRRGMDFVAITDHDTIAGALQIADRPDVIVGEELTAWFRGEPQAVHVLVLGINQDDHDWLQAHNYDLERCAEYLHEREILAAVAHPFYDVEAPLTARHRRQLAELFPVWETRNGSRARELNAPAGHFIETAGGIGVGGSDDHAGVDIGRTYTETPLAYTPAEFLAHIRAGRAVARGSQGSAERWAHAAIGLALRALGTDDGDGSTRPSAGPRPEAVATILSRFLRDADARRGDDDEDVDLHPDDARLLLRAWRSGVGLDGLTDVQVLGLLQADDFDHRDLYRRARHVHQERLRAVSLGVGEEIAAVAEGRDHDLAGWGESLLDAVIPVLPYVAATAFLGRERRKLQPQVDGELPRIALVADGIGSVHGVTHTLDTLRERGAPGFVVEVLGTDPNVDRRLPAVASCELLQDGAMHVGVPTVPALVAELAEGRFDAVHVVAPGPAGIAALIVAKLLELPVIGSFHTELGAYAAARTGDPELMVYVDLALGAFYGHADVVLSPSVQTDETLERIGVAADRVGRWDRGVDLTRFRPDRRSPQRAAALFRGATQPDRIYPDPDLTVPDAPPVVGDRRHVLYAGRLTTEKGVDLLADAFLAARRRDPRLHLVLAGDGPERGALARRLGDAATFLGWVRGGELADVYANADAFLFASETDTFGQVVLEAQASGLPVIAVDAGGPQSLINDGVSGLLRAPDADALADALVAVIVNDTLRARLVQGGLDHAAARTWEAATERLGRGYRRALAAGTLHRAQRDAAAEVLHDAVRPDRRRRRRRAA